MTPHTQCGVIIRGNILSLGNSIQSLGNSIQSEIV